MTCRPFESGHKTFCCPRRLLDFEISLGKKDTRIIIVVSFCILLIPYIFAGILTKPVRIKYLMGESSKVTVKLMVDKAANRVLFAEAGKDFVDFIFCIQELPVGIVSRLVRSVSDDALGSMHNIENSIKNLPDRYMISNQKALLLDPQVRNCGLRLGVSSNSPSLRTVYGCENAPGSCRAVLDNPHDTCTKCGRKIRNIFIRVVEPSNEAVVALHDGEGGYVKGLATYMVTDDLVVKPMMFDSCCDVIREFKVKGLEDIEEKVIDVSSVECKKLLATSLRSKTVLTDTFLPKKPQKSPPPIMFSGGSISDGSST